jgi:hypothetical protein
MQAKDRKRKGAVRVNSAKVADGRLGYLVLGIHDAQCTPHEVAEYVSSPGESNGITAKRLNALSKFVKNKRDTQNLVGRCSCAGRRQRDSFATTRRRFFFPLETSPI